MAKLVGVAAEMKRLRDHVKKFEQEAVGVVRSAAFTVLRELFARTPVWSGETVRNYAVGVGRRPSGGSRAPLGTGDPGPTNDMALGEEPRRAVNEASAMAEATPVLMQMNKLQTVYFENFVDGAKWNLIDSGNAPGGLGQVVRNPGGVEKIAAMNAKARLGGKFK